MDNVATDIAQAPDSATQDTTSQDASGSPSTDAADSSSSEQSAPRGRAAYKARYKQNNPDASDDVDDDTLYDDALSSLTDAQSKYNELAGSNKRLAEIVVKDPKAGAILSMMAGEDGKSMAYAIAKVFGDDFKNLEGDDLEEFEKGYKEHLEQVDADKKAIEEANVNIAQFYTDLTTFVDDEKLSQTEADKLHDAISEYAVGILNGKIPKEFIDFLWKGINYDKDVESAAKAGEIEGKNTVIRPELRKVAEVKNARPGVSADSEDGNRQPVRVKKSFYDDIKDA